MHDFLTGYGQIGIDHGVIAIEDGSGFVSTNLHRHFFPAPSPKPDSHTASAQVVQEQTGVLSHGGRALRKSKGAAAGFLNGVAGLDPFAVPMTQQWAPRLSS